MCDTPKSSSKILSRRRKPETRPANAKSPNVQSAFSFALATSVRVTSILSPR